MTTVSSTLKMFDAMSGPLKSITQGMNLMIGTMQKMQSAANQNHNVDKMLITAKNHIAQAEAQIQQAIEQSTNEQNRFNRAVNNGKRETDGLLGGLKGIAAAYLSFQGARELLGATLGGAMQQQQMLDTISARAGNTALGNAIYDTISRQALRLGQNVDQALSGTMSFMSNTMDPKQLAEINMLATRLSKLNPAEGLEGAAFSLKELMSGDYTSIVERFNMSRSLVRDSAARKSGMAGDIPGFIKAMDDLLNKQNMTKKALEDMLESPAAKWQKAVNTFQFNLAQTGRLGLQSLQPLIDFINEGFESGKFQPFFDALTIGLKMFADVSATTGQFIIENLDLIRAVLLAIGIVLAGLAIQWLISWVVAAWPVFAVIGAIAGLLYVLDLLGISTDQVVGFVMGTFYTMFAYLWNQIAFLYNPILAFAEFLVNVFIDPVYAVKKLFYDLVKNVVDYFGNMINGITGKIDWLIGKLNDVAGTNIGVIGTIDSSWVENLKPEKDSNVVDFSKYRMEMKDLGAAFDTGYEKGAGFIASAANALKNFDLKGPGAIPTNIDKVNEVGKIKDTVDISSEDLKIMRELAEMKNIQNFVTLTPKVSVRTGPINKGADIDEVVERITKAMEMEITSTAQGVYE